MLIKSTQNYYSTFKDNEELMLILKIVNMVFAVLFTIEMLLKWVAFGLWRYFTSAWTCLDFVIVCVSYYGLSFIIIRGSVFVQDSKFFIFLKYRYQFSAWLLKEVQILQPFGHCAPSVLCGLFEQYPDGKE